MRGKQEIKNQTNEREWKKMNKEYSLCDIKPGESATVSALRTKGGIRRRFLDIGLTENTRVECVGRSPLGDPSAYLIRGAVIAIRSEDSRDIIVQKRERCT